MTWSNTIEDARAVEKIEMCRIMALIGGVGDGYVASNHRFFAIAPRLPIEIQEWIVILARRDRHRAICEWDTTNFIGSLYLDERQPGGSNLNRFLYILQRCALDMDSDHILRFLPGAPLKPMVLIPSGRAMMWMLRA